MGRAPRASFPLPPGGDASSRRAPGTRSPELGAEVEAEPGLLGLRGVRRRRIHRPEYPHLLPPKSDVGFLRGAALNAIASLRARARVAEDDDSRWLQSQTSSRVAPDTPSPSSALRVLPMPPTAPMGTGGRGIARPPTTNFNRSVNSPRMVGASSGGPARAASTTASASRTISPRARSTGSNATSAIA